MEFIRRRFRRGKKVLPESRRFCTAAGRSSLQSPIRCTCSACRKRNADDFPSRLRSRSPAARHQTRETVSKIPLPKDPHDCSHRQIHTPPAELSDILKQFTNEAIRAQPKDVLAWSEAYFRALANEEVPSVEAHLETTTAAAPKIDTELTPRLLRILNRQIGPNKTISLVSIEGKWTNLALPKEQFDDLVRIGNFTGDVTWLQFLALACSRLSKDITGAMKTLCEILTHDPDGGAARIPFRLFQDLYEYLAKVDGNISQEHVSTVIEQLGCHVKRQGGYVQPRNFTGPHCPALLGESPK